MPSANAEALCVGFDPGGRNAFGWCVASFAHSEPIVRGDIASSAREAFAAVVDVLDNAPAAVGIDAPLFWSLDSERAADRAVRKLMPPGRSPTVGHINSLRGACLVQGVLVARMAAEAWPDAAITEAHPKALLEVCGEARDFIAQQAHLAAPGHHVRDAALAAFAARAAALRAAGWRDLAADEAEPFFPGGSPVSYWFPAGAAH